MKPIIETRRLIKHYPGITAVNGVSLSVASGSCLGLLGPNGAGKTTLVEMLEGITQPSAGEILYKGAPLGPRFRLEAGIMFQATALQDFITTHEALSMFAALYPQHADLATLIDQCHLGDFLDRDTRKLSGGQRQRLLLAIALVGNPAIVFLDEPTTGLDPQSRHNFWSLIRSIQNQGTTIVLTTHYMEEAYSLCDHLAIMDHGEIIAEGTPGALLASHFGDSVLSLPRSDCPDDLNRLGLEILDKGDTIEILSTDINSSLQQLIAHGISLSRLSIRERNLEDLFLELTGKEIRA